ncbi:MAG: class I SAM-dependent methyltransferase [Gaiellaceae bacterium]
MTAGAYSIPEVKRLLAALVAAKPEGRIAEAGASYGEGAEAIAAALGPRASFVTCESDPERAAAARARLAGLAVELVEGRWQDVLPQRAPFDLLFFDAGGIDESVIDLLAPGGILVKDDMTPGHPVEGDPVRELLLRDPRLEAVELLTTPDAAAIVAVRKA